MNKKEFHLIVGITGASGVIYAVRLLEELAPLAHIKTHLVISGAGKQTLNDETDYSVQDLKNLCDYYYDIRDIGASIASGSFRANAMVILPCTIKTLSSIAHCYSENLISRAADVMLKESKPLLLCVRETPFHLGHIDLMKQAVQIGAKITPLMPAFYHRPKSLDDIINQGVMRVCDQLGIELDIAKRWKS